jgi:hypothetical protein
MKNRVFRARAEKKKREKKDIFQSITHVLMLDHFFSQTYVSDLILLFFFFRKKEVIF